jgi:recombination protein RecA
MAKKPAEPTTEPKPTLNRIIAELNKKFGLNIIGRLGDMPTIQIPRLSTSIAPLDVATGGGLPAKGMIELFGIPSSGKSLISLLTIAQAQKEGKECVYIDAENSFDPHFAEQLGVDVKKLVVTQVSIGEDTIDLLCKLLPSVPAIIVIDSIAALITQDEVDEPMEKNFMAVKARLLSRALAKINVLNKGTLIIGINQLRSTMALYGPQTTTPGGRAVGHWSLMRIEVKKSELLYEEDKKTNPVIGQLVSCTVVKNKTAPPYKLGSFKFFYDPMRVEVNREKVEEKGTEG